MQLSSRQVAVLRDQLETAQRGYMLSASDHAKGRPGAGQAIFDMAHASRSGGALPIFVGRGVPPSYACYEHHVGGMLPIMLGGDLPNMHGGDLPVIGGGIGSFFKKIGSLGRKVVSKVLQHGKKAVTENADALKSIARGAAEHVMNGEGSLKDRLRGGVARAADQGAELARGQVADRIRNLITS